MANNDDLQWRIATIEGEVVALRVLAAALFYSLRTGESIGSVYREVRRYSEFLKEEISTLFPEERAYFKIGFTQGFVSSEMFTYTLHDLFADLRNLRHDNPPEPEV